MSGSQLTANDIQDARRLILNFGNHLINSLPEGFVYLDCDVVHRFSKGCYLREIFMPAGARVVGRIHTTEHFNIILKGSATVITADEQYEIVAPYTFVSLAGTQKVVMVHDDCVWQTVHVTDETDIERLEAMLTVEKYEDLESDQMLEKYRLLS